MTKSLKENEILLVKLPDGGKVIPYRRVSPLLVMEIQTQFPAPEPPLQKVDYGDGKERFEPNPQAPEYIKAMTEHAREFETKMRRLIIKRGVRLVWTDEMREELADLRKYWQDEYGKTLGSGDDLVDYIQYIAVGGKNDLSALVDAILFNSQATEKGVEQALNSFPGDVSGS